MTFPYAALILAAGHSSRMKRGNKLLLPVRGVPMLARVARSMLDAGLEEVVVVTGNEAEQVGTVVQNLPVHIAHNPAFADGMASSIRTGVAAITTPVAGYVVGLGDMPFVDPETIRTLVQIARQNPGKIIAPYHAQKQGHPVVFDVAYRKALCSLHGDKGAKRLMIQHPGNVIPCPVDDVGVLRDIDTDDAYAHLALLP